MPLVVAGVRLTPCLLGMGTSVFRASGVPGSVPGAGVVDRATVSIAGSSTFACAWSWQSLLCRPLAEFARWLHPTAATGTVAPVVLLLIIPAVATLLLSGLMLLRAVGTCAGNIARARAGARGTERLLLPGSHASTHRITTLLDASAGFDSNLQVRVFDDARPLAWTYGLWHPQVALSSGLLARLDDAALAAVLAHEASHVRRRDPLRRLISRTIVQACPFAPVLRALDAHLHLRQEVEADQTAMASNGPAALARALVVWLEPEPTTLTTARTATSETRRPSRILPALLRRDTSETGQAHTDRAQREQREQEVSESLTRRIDHMLGRAAATNVLVPSVTMLLTVLGLATTWCLLVW